MQTLKNIKLYTYVAEIIPADKDLMLMFYSTRWHVNYKLCLMKLLEEILIACKFGKFDLFLFT
jgi:hypothetical protein